ncbi:MAG: AmmeMemoRadiSam system radical SAM enzyme [Candidatus Odinarchaeota archaeon]
MKKINKDVFQRKALLQTPAGNSKIQCGTCWHKCTIPEGKHGFCRTRVNIAGTLYCINYGMVSSFSVNPIEKKPLFHYYPGTYASTVGSSSCNFKCPWCQNWQLSKTYPFEEHVPRYLPPGQLVKQTEEDPGIDGISISFNEPTLSLEYALDVFHLCRPDTYRSFVTNGYMTSEALELLVAAGLTGMSITVKGDAETVRKHCKADVEKVWQTIETAYREGVHIEIICLVIPTVNDSKEFFRNVAKRLFELDENIPLHFTRFHPDYQFTEVEATPVQVLEEAHDAACSEGLKFVYLGNVPGHRLENTYCPHCGQLLIKRTGYRLEMKFELITRHCPTCGTGIPLYLG